jgi:hypothetical protein
MSFALSVSLLAQVGAGAPLLHCEVRTPAGDIVTFDARTLPARDASLPALVTPGRDASLQPSPGRSYIWLPTGEVGSEIEFKLGARFIRLGSSGSERTLTLLSSRDGKPALALAFGFCSTRDLGLISSPGPIDERSDVFSPLRWKDRCYFTAPFPARTRGTFLMDHSSTGGAISVSFEPIEGDIWSARVIVPRQILRPLTKAVTSGVSLEVGRFAPEIGKSGPSGMDMIYIDNDVSKGSVVVQFKSFDDKGQPGYAICGVTSLVNSRP